MATTTTLVVMLDCRSQRRWALREKLHGTRRRRRRRRRRPSHRMQQRQTRSSLLQRQSKLQQLCLSLTETKGAHRLQHAAALPQNCEQHCTCSFKLSLQRMCQCVVRCFAGCQLLRVAGRD
jgi:hypothetical protein